MKIFENMTLKVKIAISPIVVGVLFVILTIVYIMPSLNRDLESQSKEKIRQHTEVAQSIITSFYEKYKTGELTEDQAKNEVLHLISTIRYDNGTGYFWINDTTFPYPTMIMHPTLPKLNGTVLNSPEYNVAFGSGQNLFQAFVEVTSGGTYLIYYGS